MRRLINKNKNRSQNLTGGANLKGTQKKQQSENQSKRRKVRPTGVLTGKILQGKNLVSFTPVGKYLVDPGSKYGKLLRRYHNELINYFKCLFNPELAVSGDFVAKQPSFTPIPTSNVTFKEQIYFNTSKSGDFDMIWVPNFFCTDASLRDIYQPGLSKTYTAYSHLYYEAPYGLDHEWFAHSSYSPAIALAKYRLVSAKLVVEYNGPLINKGGSLQSCAIYDDLPVMTIESNIYADNYNISKNMNSHPVPQLLDQFTDIELVRNGLWNRYVNVSNTNANKIECLAVPTDPTDQTFYPMGHYYSQEPSTPVSNTGSDGPDYKYGSSTDGGHLSFIIKGTGMTANDNPVPIIATVYYNFEVIANQSTAPFLRAKTSSGEWSYILQSVFSKVSEAVKSFNAEGKKITEQDIMNMIPDIKLPNGVTMSMDKEDL